MKKIDDCKEDIAGVMAQFPSNYKFQPVLTEKLDAHTGDFTEKTILEIVLWKVNRYPETSGKLVDAINDLRNNYTEEKGKKLLNTLLDKKGFDLPMASTLLRFARPDKFQIIDQRVYRLITKNCKKLKLPTLIEEKITLYYNYLERLKTVCDEYNIPFEKSDRILYLMDKSVNNNERLANYGRTSKHAEIS